MSENDLIPLSEVPKLLPRRRNGRRVHTSTVYRWTTRGINGVLLAVVQVGRIRCTTKIALNEFFTSLAAVIKTVPKAQKRTIQGDSRAARARRELDSAGIGRRPQP